MIKRKVQKVFLDTIKEYELLSYSDTVLIAISGGPDSVALLFLLKEIEKDYNLKLFLAHLNHNLRGKESDEDAEFVKSLSKKLNVELFLKTLDKNEIKKEKGSLEEVARRKRYEFLEEIARKISADKVALGHTLDDHVETILMRFIRGSGFMGLSGIPIKRGIFIRPLIKIKKDEILSYLKEENLSYRIDSSNFDKRFTRNRIRLDLIPLIEEYLNPSFKEKMWEFSQIIEEEDKFLENEVKKIFCEICEVKFNECILNIEKFKNLPLAIKRRIIRKIFLAFEKNLDKLSFSHVEKTISFIENAKSGRTLTLPSFLKAIKEFNFIRFTQNIFKKNFYLEIQKIDKKYKIPEISLEFFILSKKPKKLKRKNKSILFADFNKISFPIIIRSRREGDRFLPFGMKNYVKLKKFFIERKIPKTKRDIIPLILSKNEIIAIAGVEISDKVKIEEKTEKILVIKSSILK